MVKMQFNYSNENNQIKKINIEVGKEWNSYKDKNNPQSALNSVFNFVDSNSDGKVDEEELDILQKLLKIADSQIDKLKKNNIIEKEEVEYIVDKIKQDELHTLEENKSPNQITPKTINLPNDKNKFTNYTYLVADIDPDDENNTIVYKTNVDYSELSKRDSGNYYVEGWDTAMKENNVIQTPVMRKIQESNQDGTTNWSEGINRNISKIQFANSGDDKLMAFMKQVGEEQGFSVEILDIDKKMIWTEDQSIVRADKKQLIPNCSSEIALQMYQQGKKVITQRKQISLNEQGSAIQKNQPFDDSTAIKYSHTVSPDDIIRGKTYLEGGNVLNTLTKDGEPAAIIGEESLKYTIIAMMTDDSDGTVEYLEKLDAIDFNNVEEYTIKAKKQIAQELGLKEENITYIPQFDFHIDMYYRPLNDGQMAIPDYQAGIEVLSGLLQDIDTQIESANLSSEQKDSLQKKKVEYNKLLGQLEIMKSKTESISTSAEKELKEKGYDIVKIPCFTDIDNGKDQRLDAKPVENPINYMNGICGTSAKTGDKYYITNTSGDETLNKYMENYFKNTVGFDKVYFAPTKQYLSGLGGIDCLTKEL